MLQYKIDVLAELKEAGYTPARMRKEKLLGENAIQSLREGKIIGTDSLNKICGMLELQPGTIIRWIPDERKK